MRILGEGETSTAHPASHCLLTPSDVSRLNPDGLPAILGPMLAASHLSNDNGGSSRPTPPPTLSTAAAADGVAMTAVRVRDSTATAIGVGGLAQVAGEGASRPR